ncbi:MAG TPA: zf-HC2 domain-containing protein [Terriglobia bacterium]|nr:zf-HC2 domain-containing protein [Terriglobia bacterium]
MNCKELERYAIPYLDGKLARKDAAAVQQHLAGCAACARRLRGFSAVGSLLDAWEPVQPSPAFDLGLQQRLRAEAASPAGWRERLWLWLPVDAFARPALAGALLGILLVAVALTRFIPAHTGEALGASAEQPLFWSAPVPVDTAPADADYDELALYQQLPVLENLELLSNFEVLQELKTTTQ